MSEYLYSAKNNAFYPVSLKEIYESADSWPEDGISVNELDYQRFMNGQSTGRVITAGDNGLPELTDISVDYVAIASAQRDQKMSVITLRITALVEAQDDGDITQDELEELAKLRADRVALRRLDLSSAPDIEWPA